MQKNTACIRLPSIQRSPFQREICCRTSLRLCSKTNRKSPLLFHQLRCYEEERGAGREGGGGGGAGGVGGLKHRNVLTVDCLSGIFHWEFPTAATVCVCLCVCGCTCMRWPCMWPFGRSACCSCSAAPADLASTPFKEATDESVLFNEK